jgi:hypothetical protein
VWPGRRGIGVGRVDGRLMCISIPFHQIYSKQPKSGLSWLHRLPLLRILRAEQLAALSQSQSSASSPLLRPLPLSPIQPTKILPCPSALCLQPQRPFPFSDPFIMSIGPEDTVGQLRARVQRQLGVPEEELEGSCKPVLIT